MFLIMLVCTLVFYHLNIVLCAPWDRFYACICALLKMSYYYYIMIARLSALTLAVRKDTYSWLPRGKYCTSVSLYPFSPVVIFQKILPLDISCLTKWYSSRWQQGWRCFYRCFLYIPILSGNILGEYWTNHSNYQHYSYYCLTLSLCRR